MTSSIIAQGAEAIIHLVDSKEVSPKKKSQLKKSSTITTSSSTEGALGWASDFARSNSEGKNKKSERGRELGGDSQIILKNRIPKSYRIQELDEKIRKLRSRSESKLLEKASKIIPIPKVLNTDEKLKQISMEFLDGKKLSQHLDDFSLKEQKSILNQIGKSIGKLHEQNIIHGDLTTSNMILMENAKSDKSKSNSNKNINNKIKSQNQLPDNNLSAENPSEAGFEAINSTSDSEEQFKTSNEPIIYFIDFGLGFQNGKYEDKGVDIHLLKQALEAKHFKNWEQLFQEFEKGYSSINPKESKKVFERLKAIERRGRYRH